MTTPRAIDCGGCAFFEMIDTKEAEGVCVRLPPQGRVWSVVGAHEYCHEFRFPNNCDGNHGMPICSDRECWQR